MYINRISNLGKNKGDNEYICNVKKGNESIGKGIGNTKKKAEQDSAKNALIKYGVLN